MSEEKPVMRILSPNEAITGKVIETLSDEDTAWLLTLVEGYKKKGMNQTEAEVMAQKELEETKDKFQAQGEIMWNKLNKEFRTWQLYHDQMLRALAFYSAEWEKKNAPQTLRFNFRLTTNGARNRKGQVTIIASANLILDFAINGVWKKWFHKSIHFKHYREMKEGDQWKLELYEAAFREFILYGTTYMLTLDGYNSGRIKVSDPTGGEPTTAGTSTGEPANSVPASPKDGEGTPAAE
jgi:hypothetical protein